MNCLVRSSQLPRRLGVGEFFNGVARKWAVLDGVSRLSDGDTIPLRSGSRRASRVGLETVGSGSPSTEAAVDVRSSWSSSASSHGKTVSVTVVPSTCRSIADRDRIESPPASSSDACRLQSDADDTI